MPLHLRLPVFYQAYEDSEDDAVPRQRADVSHPGMRRVERSRGGDQEGNLNGSGDVEVSAKQGRLID